jgi:hypothetical protein
VFCFVGIELNQSCRNSAHARCREWRYMAIQPEDTDVIIEINFCSDFKIIFNSCCSTFSLNVKELVGLEKLTGY